MLHFPLQPAWCFRVSERGKKGEKQCGKKRERGRWGRKWKKRKEKFKMQTDGELVARVMHDRFHVP